MKRLNFFWPNTVYTDGQEYYISRPWFLNELSKYFNIHYFCNVERKNSIDLDIYTKINSDVTIHQFFDELSQIKFFYNYKKYRREINHHCDVKNDLFFIFYPYKSISIGLAWLLKDTKLIIWVKSRPFEAINTFSEDPVYTPFFTNIIKYPGKFVYSHISERLLENNLVFYTGNILFNIDDHQTQNRIISISRLNTDSSRINYEFTNKIIFIGDESRKKGLGYLLDVFDSIDDEYKLTIMGIDELRKYAAYRDHPQIQVVGKIYDKKKFYDILSDHDILVLPSMTESQGKVQLEAMSVGVVPICADVGGVHTTIQNMYNGLLFDRSQPYQLVELIHSLYARPEFYSRLVENGRTFSETFSIENQVEMMTTIIKHYYGSENLHNIYSNEL